MTLRSLTYGLPLILPLLFPMQAHAHPHSTILLETELTQTDTHWTGARMVWRFDEMASSQMVMGANLTGKVEQRFLDALAPELQENITNQHFFSEFYADTTPLVLSPTSEFVMGQKGREITVSFSVQFNQPVPRDTELRWRSFEPEFYVDIRYESDSDISIKNAPNCSLSLSAIEADDALIAYADNLDKQEQSDIPNLGQYFAQWASVTCQ